MRDLRRKGQPVSEDPGTELPLEAPGEPDSDRPRRIRDAVEAALSDVVLLGTEEHIRLAERALRELVSGNPVHTAELVVSLRDFVREALGLAPVPPDVAIPMQGPTRPTGSSGGRGGRNARGEAGAGGGGGQRGGGGGGGAGGGMGMGMGGAALGMGMGAGGSDPGDRN